MRVWGKGTRSDPEDGRKKPLKQPKETVKRTGLGWSSTIVARKKLKGSKAKAAGRDPGHRKDQEIQTKPAVPCV